MRRFWIVAIMLAVCGGSAMADEAKPLATEPLSLTRVFGSPAIGGAAPKAVKLSPDGRWVTSLRPRDTDRERFDLWAMDTSTGQSKMLVDSLKIGSGAEISEAEKMQRERARISGSKGIVAYDWSPDAKTILVPIDGDLFLAGLDGKVRRLTNSAAGELDATVSPKGGFVSFVRDQNLYVTDLVSGKERALTSTGGGTLSWGVAEFVAQEEMHRTRGAWWSPDDKLLAVARVDEDKVAVVSRAAIGAEGTKVYDQRYPLAGTPNALVELYIMSVDGTAQIKVDLGKNADIYLARVDWMPDGKALIVQRQSRDHKTLDVLRIDAVTGAATPLFTESARSWINLHDNLRILKDGSLIWTSERDGYSHIWRLRGKKWMQLTKGLWEVRDIVGVDEGQGVIYFTGNRETPLQQHLYTVRVNGGSTTQITPLGWWHNVTMDKGASRAIVSRSNANGPPQVYLADATGRRIAWIEENKLDARHPYARFMDSHVPPKFGTIAAADGTILHTKLLTPPLTPGVRYPVLVQVYGGPGAGRQVTDQWGGALHQYLVDQGWIVFSVDNRGSPDRGKAFEDHIYRAMGSVEVADQLEGVKWLKEQAFVDPGKIAVYGWSYGGYMTLKLLEAAPGTFAAGVAGAPVTKWELYDTHYTERFLGSPVTEPKVYEKANALANAEKINDPLLLIHGMADDNVVFEHSTALMAKLQGAARPFETMVYPGQSHSVGGPKVSVHLWQGILNFLDRTVKTKR
jgi:dipeptidyl-peptidase 4